MSTNVWTQAPIDLVKLVAMASAFETMYDYDDQHPANVGAEQRRWQIEEAFELNRLHDYDAAEWSAWFAEEKHLWSLDGEPDRYDQLEQGWLADPLDPIVVVEGSDGKFYPWDGCHRIGISATHGQHVVLALVGYRS